MDYGKLIHPPAKDMKQIAYYYPNPVWDDGDWIKNMILFFDGIALLVPNYLKDKPYRIDPSIATGLENEGLLSLLDPEQMITREVAEGLSLVVLKALESNEFECNPGDDIPFHQLSYSRLISREDPEIGERLFSELQSKGLALPSEDGLAFPIHPDIRNLILVTLAQLIKSNYRSLNHELFPVTNHPEVHLNFQKIIGLKNFPSKGHVISFDLETVGVDLSPYPLDEVLDFRKQHGSAYQDYSKQLRVFLRDISTLDAQLQIDALLERQQEIKDISSDLRKFIPKEWSKAVALSFSLAGAAWTAHSNDLIGSLLALGACVLSAHASTTDALGCYSYIFQARDRFK